MKKNYYLFFALLMVLLHSCKGDDPTINNQPNNVEVEDITLNYATLSLEVGQSKQLIASIHPSDATDTRIMWVSDNSSIADVDNGLVIAYKSGTAIITASTYDGVHSAQCKVTVAREEEEIINVTSVSLNKTSLSLKEGESFTLSCTVQPSNATDKSVRWISSNTSVASVNNSGKVTALKEGTSTITVTTNDGGYTAKCTVTVDSQNQSKAKIVKLYADVSYTGWNQCNIYIWDSAGEWAVWPGKPIEKTTIDGKSYYVFAFDKSAYGKTISVIFNNGSGEQTVDITDVTLNKDYVFKLTQKNNEGKWTANISSSVPNNVYSVVGSFNDWSTDVMFEAMGDGGYGLLGLSLTAKDEFKIRANKDWVETGNFGLPSVSTLVTNAANNLIVGYDSQNMKVANDGVYDFYFYPSELTLYVMESEDDPTPPSDAKSVKLYANVSATGWSKCNIYIWDNSGQYFNWPGVGIQKTTVSGNTYYVYTCDVNMYGKTVSIIFNNGTEQTADIPNVVLNKDYVFTLTQKNNEGKWQANASTSFENSLVLTSNSNNDIPASASEYEISFTSPSNWTASTDCSWITLSSSSGVAGQQTITANIAKNLSTSQRKGNVTIKSGNDSKKVTYTQAGAINSDDDDDDDNNNISPDNHSEISYKVDLNNLFNKSDDSACEEMLNEVCEQYDMSGFEAEFIEAKYSNGWVTLCFDKDVKSVPKCLEIVYASSADTIVLPNSVTKIADQAFLNCVNASINLPESLQYIGSYAFYGNKRMTQLNLPINVVSIGESAFSDCISLVRVIIPNSVTTIGKNIFKGCSSLTSVTIPNSVTTIGESAFDDCSSLTSLTIPNSVTTIGDRAFDDCSSLTSLTIPNSVTTIGYRAFGDCSSLTSLTIPNGVTTIGIYAFENCSSLTSVTIPNSVTSIGSSAFSGCTGELIINNNVIIETNYTVTNYPSRCWLAGAKFTKLTIPNSVTTIGDYAFSDCSSLTSVTIPNSVTTIGESAFEDCSSLTSLTIPNSVTTIGVRAFGDCSSLTSLTIPNSVTTIGNYAFENCSSLTSVTIPNSVTSIGSSAFSGCTGELIINNKVLVETDYSILGVGAYPSYHGWLAGVKFTKLTIGNGIMKIGMFAFYDCSSFISVTIPDSVTSIEASAFSKCSNLTSVTVPDSVTTIKSSVFSNCSSLTSVTMPDSVTTIEHYTFKNCSNLTSIVIPNSVTTVGTEVFYNCSSLTSVTIPDSVTSIGEKAFYECSSLTSVTIGSSLALIGDQAFYDCISLKSVYCKATTPPEGGYSMFSGNASGRKIYVPMESVEVYKSYGGWWYEYKSDIVGYNF